MRKLVLISLCCVILIQGFKQEDFKKCTDSSFCKRQRSYQPETSPYVADFDSLTNDHNGKVTLEVTHLDNGHPYNMEVYAVKDGIVRIKINEAAPIMPRHEVPDTLQELKLQKFHIHSDKKTEVITLSLVDSPNMKVQITCHPLRVDVLDGDEPVMSLNSKNKLNIEHLRKKPEFPSQSEDNKEVVIEGQEESPAEKTEEEKKIDEAKAKLVHEEAAGMWEEKFKSHNDRKPRGPESIGLDTSFIDFAHVYGIPEHADSLALKSTLGTEPYRLYNLDVFEYGLDSKAALYGSIPLIIAHNVKRTVGLFWLNAAETWVDVDKSADGKGVLATLFGYFATKEEEVPEVDVHWMSESGVIDVFIMCGPSPADVTRQYSSLTGTSYMPPKWSLAYHQSRWNYKDERDVDEVDKKFDEHDIPYDCLWLDIEHTNGKRYFTWDTAKFPSPIEMQEKLAAKGRKMVTIIDPHIKVDNNYHIYSEAKSLDHFIKDKDGNEFRGWCWPGDSGYLDFTKPVVRDWWASQFSPEIYKGSTKHLFTWNDMNEPSVFNGPEITMHKDAKHANGWEHRHVHNMYGMLQQMSTFKGQLMRSEGNERPFVLSRAFFPGTQKYGAIWTGDNTAEWGHLAASNPMLLTISMAGISHCGADVGGFFKNPDPELLSRWYQAAAYQPFFRAHAHIETTRREPWLYDDATKDVIRSSIRQRYQLLPFWYTLFYRAHKSGEPPMRPLWFVFPDEASTFATEDTYMLGDSLLVKPVSQPGKTASQVYLPGSDGWYDVFNQQYFPSPNTANVETPAEHIAVLQRGGSIIPRKMRVRRCSSLMTHDPYTLFAGLNPQRKASGELYMDDGHTYNFQAGQFNHINYTFAQNVLESTLITPQDSYKTDSWLERVVVMGVSQAPTKITIEQQDGVTKNLGFEFDGNKRVLTIRKPGVNIATNWKITMS